MNPSLLLIPDRYKASKLYSQIPDSGAGDLAFTRANDTATRVNSAGLIEKVRTNLALQSEAFNTTWLTYAGTNITADAVAAPNGTLTADRIDGTSASFRGIYQTISSSAIPHTFSVYLKSATGSSTTCRIWVDSVASLVTITNNWQRFVVTGTTAASFDIQITAAVASAIDVYAWGAQLETGDIATPYIPTTTAAVSVGPVANIPRIDYTGGGCGKLLLEPQRTNVALFSEQFNNAGWTKQTGNSIDSNFAISPSGIQDADKITATNGNSINTFQVNSIGAGAYTFSVYLKNDGTNLIEIYTFRPGVGLFAIGELNFSAGTFAATVGSGKIESFQNGWFRVSLTNTYTAGNLGIAIFTTSTTGIRNVLAWGAQLELGSYATSYINTLGASVTRSADAASKTGISSLIGQSEGVMFVDFEITSLPQFVATPIPISITNTGGSNEVFIQIFSLGRVAAGVIVGGVLTNFINLPDFGLTNGRHKMAYAYKQNDFALFIDGTLAGSGSSGITGACSEVYIQKLPEESRFNTAALYTSRLLNSELQTLTTL